MQSRMTVVRFYDFSFAPPGKLLYSVIAARYKGRWIFVRHAMRDTWEIPGGHIEVDETPEDAAVRELQEETGAIEFRITSIATYSVETDISTDYGRLFFAEVLKPGRIPDSSEIEESALMKNLPENLTYPDIQPVLFSKIKDFLSKGGRS